MYSCLCPPSIIDLIGETLGQLIPEGEIPSLKSGSIWKQLSFHTRKYSLQSIPLRKYNDDSKEKFE